MTTIEKKPSFSQTARLTYTAAWLAAGLGCKDLAKDPGLPAGTPDPSAYNTPAGAIGLRNAAIISFQQMVTEYIQDAGLLSDELQDRYVGASTGILLQNGQAISDPLDERILPDGGVGGSGFDGKDSYAYLQSLRGTANIALAALAMYDTAASSGSSQRAMRGELFAMQGYAEILLAEMFCSGVPLSTLDFHGDYTYGPSLTTVQVYQDAVVKLDSAQQLTAVTDSVHDLALLLRGRAQLGLGHYVTAADDVSTVPTTFQYRLPVPIIRLTDFYLSYGTNQRTTVADSEGENGLPFVSSADPRTATKLMCTPPDTRCPTVPLRFPTKYVTGMNGGAYNAFVVGNGIEARLIQAEAALNAGDSSWLTILNALRTNGTATTIPADTLLDTLGGTDSLVVYPTHQRWNAGTGGVDGLAPLSDPGNAQDRLALLFQERAYWLFVTGHRLGDMRRLLRQYGRQSQYSRFRSEQQVFPVGLYLAPGTGRYGSDINAAVPTSEYANPNYHGCIDRNA